VKLTHKLNYLNNRFRKLDLSVNFELRNPHMIRLLVLALCFSEAFQVFGQQRVIDSLAGVLESTPDKQKRVDILNEITFAYFDYNNEAGFDYASQAYDLALEINYEKGLRQALTYKGFYHSTKGSYPNALEYFWQSRSRAPEKDDLQGYTLVMIGNVHRAMARYDSAAHYYGQAIEIFNATKSGNYLAYAYKNLGRLYVLQWRNQEAEEIFQKSLVIYETQKNKAGIADTWFSLSDVSKNKAEFSKASEYVEKACAFSDEVGEEFLQVLCLINRSDIKYRLGDYTESLRISFEALGVLKSKDLPLMLAEVYSTIGNVYRALGQNEVAMKYFLEALKITERIGVKYEIAKLYASLATIYRAENNFRKSHESIDLSLKLRSEIKDEQGVSHSYNLRGLTYFHEKKYPEALEALDRSLTIRRAIGYREGIASCLYNISQVCVALNQFPRAIALQTEALAIENAIGNKFNTGSSHNRLGGIYTRLRKFDLAQLHLKRAELIAQEIKSIALVRSNHLNWASFFEARGNAASALQHFKKYTAAHDSLYSDIGAQKLAELQALYLMEQKDQEIEMLSQEKTIHENEIQLQRSRIYLQNIIIISVAGGLVMMSLLAIIIYRYNRRIKKAHREIIEQKEEIQSQSEELIEASQTITEINKKLEGKIEERTLALSQAYKELDTFFYRSSHDFRRPLTTFLGLAEVAKVTVKDVNALELFDKVRETASNLDKMLVKLQSISDVGSQQLVYKEVMIKEIYDTVCDGFRDELHRKNIKTSIEIRLQVPFISYPAMVKIIIENLVENAIHFSGVEHPFIKLKAYRDGDYVTIDIQDNGQGIPKEYQEHIFDMYFRANERSKGNGLGLYIVKKAVQKLDGSITFSTLPLVGTTFTVMFPVNFQR
jgi:signal transduction histidine kinase